MRKHFGNGAPACALALMVALLFAGSIAMKSLSVAITLGVQQLGADLMIVPEGCEEPALAALIAGRPSPVYLPGNILDKVREVKGVKQATPQLFLKSVDFECCTTVDLCLVAFEQASDFTITPWLREAIGRPLAMNEAIIGASIPVPAGTRMRYFDTPLTVTGDLSATGLDHLDHAAIMTMGTAREMIRNAKKWGIQPLAVGEDAISAVLVELDPAVSPERAKVFVEYEIEGVTALTAQKGIGSVKRRLRILARIIGGMGLGLWPIAMALSGIVFFMVFGEGRREGALLPAMGGARRDISRMFACEALRLFLVGGIFGLGLGGGLLLFTRALAQKGFLPRLPWPDTAFVAMAALGSLGAVLAGGAVVVAGMAFAGRPAIRVEP